MASLLHKIATFNNIQAGQSLTRSWTKIDPAIAVWYIQAIPRESSFTSAQPPEQSVEVEVTRVSRKLKRALSTNSAQASVTSMRSGTRSKTLALGRWILTYTRQSSPERLRKKPRIQGNPFGVAILVICHKAL